MIARRRDCVLSLRLTLCLGLPLAVPALGAAQTLVLDADGPHVLTATPRPAPANTDPVLRMEVRLERAGVAVPSALDARDWSFARLLPDERFIGVTTDGRLWVSPLTPGAPTPASAWLDEGIEGAVGSSPDGRHLVYCRGAAPDLEVFRADDGRVRRVTSDMAPVWSPAISPDGRRVVFVSAKTGVPALYRVDDGQAPRQLTNVGVRPQPGVVPTLAPYPDALTPPLLGPAHLVFESRGAVHILDLDGRTLRVEPGATSPVWLEVGRKIGVFRPGAKTPEGIVLPVVRSRGGRK